jgi:hypothetical protein
VVVAGVHGFPVMWTSFIGRAGPVRQLSVLLEQYRLVMVTAGRGAAPDGPPPRPLCQSPRYSPGML